MANELNQNPEINPQEQAPNHIEGAPEQAPYHFKEVEPPKSEDEVVQAPEIPNHDQSPTPAELPQAPVVQESLIPDEVRIKKVEEDLKADRGDIDPHDAVENLLRMANEENPDVPFQ